MALLKDVFDFEIFLLTNTKKIPIEVDDTELKEALENFRLGNFKHILLSNIGRNILQAKTDQLVCESLQGCVEAYLSQGNTNVRQFEVLLVAVSCLQLFVQNNWLGPLQTEDPLEEIFPHIFGNPEKEKSVGDVLEEELSVDGEPIYSLSVQPFYFYIAWVILHKCREQFTELKTLGWWQLRCLGIYQQILESKSSTLQEMILPVIQEVQKLEPLMTDDKYRDLQIQFHLEAGFLCHMFYKYRKANEHFSTAHKTAAINVELTGAMGKRTKFQQENKAQLVLRVTRDESAGNSESDEKDLNVSASLPKCLNLDDDTVLDAIKFEDEGAVQSVTMSALEQAVVIGLMEDHRRSQAEHEKLTQEEVQAYLASVLKDAKNWSVTVSALIIRSKNEKTSRRLVERSMMQLEESVNQIRRPEPPACDRLELFYCSPLLPIWSLQAQLAELLISLGAVGAALEIFERLELWELAISCYQRLGKIEKAETVIREQLAIKETANLWCFLGDVTHDITCYEKAWEMSNHRSARAQRSMAYLYFGEENYEKCLECFKKSLEINSLQVPVWFTYGCAAMADNQNELAVKAFKRCVAVDTDNFEAWSNMAAAYVKLKEKHKAFLTLKDALKCNYEEWRIWDNYMLVSNDCGEFGEVIRSYHRLLDLRGKWEDTKILKGLVIAVTQNLVGANDTTGATYKPRVLELFGRMTSKVTGNAELWLLYAQLCHGEGDNEKVLQLLQKSHRSVIQTQNWEKDVEKCQSVAEQSLELADTYEECSADAGDNTKAIQMLSSAKLMLKGIVTKIKQTHIDTITQTLAEPVKEVCDHLDDKLNGIIEKINTLKSS